MRSKLLIGLVAALVLALAAPAAADSHESQVYVVHGIPDATVDVWVNEEPLLEGFEPGTITDAQTLPAGTYRIQIFPAGSDPETTDALIDVSPEVPGGANLSVVAHLDADGNPTLSAFPNDTSGTAAGEARLTARHTAAAPEVDVRADGDVLFSGVANGDEGSVDVPAGTYSADIVPAGSDEAVLGPADLDLAEDTLTVAYAIGSLDDGTLDLLVQTIATTPDAVPAGSGGMAAATSFPIWAALALALGGALIVGSGTRLVSRRS
jgi:hypothetical protein